MTQRGEPSGYTCDKCGEPILIGDLTYSIAWDHEKKIGRHSRCQPTQEQLRKNVENAMSTVLNTLNEIKRKY